MAGIIRREQVSSARVFSLTDLEQQGRQILEAAQVRAQQTLRAAEQRGRQLREEQEQAGYQAGLEEGRAAGLEQSRQEARAAAVQEARQQIAALVRALTAALNEFEQVKRSLIASAESGLIELALAVARRVCKLEAGASSAAAQANVRALLEMVQHVGDAELRLNPAEYEQLRELAPELPAHAGQLRHGGIVADPGVGRGGCVLRTRDGEIDATIETQLQRIAAALRVNTDDALPGPPAPDDDAAPES